MRFPVQNREKHSHSITLPLLFHCADGVLRLKLCFDLWFIWNALLLENREKLCFSTLIILIHIKLDVKTYQYW